MRGGFDVTAWDNVDLQHWVGCRNITGRQSQFAPHDIAALSDGAGFVEGDFAVAALAPETAVAGDDQTLGWDKLQRFANFPRYVLWRIGLQRAMAHGANGNFFLESVLERGKKLEVFLVAVFHLQRPHVAAAALQINLDGIGV